MRLGLIIFTALELGALVGWMQTSPTRPYLAIGILTIGLFLEHIVALNDFRGSKSLSSLFSVRNLPLLKLFAASISEALVWLLWLYVATSGAMGFIVAAIILLVGIFLQHNVEINIFIGRPTFEKLFSGRVVGFTITEVLAGVAWLGFITQGQPIIAVVLLAFGLYAEHLGQGEALSKAKRG